MNLWTLWGKTRGPKEAKVTHPLLCHMVDVAEVVGALWDCSLGDGLRRHVSEALGCDADAARRTLMFWAALHDLGKASPVFQKQHGPAVKDLTQQGFRFPPTRRVEACHHGAITAWALRPLLSSFGLSREWSEGVATAVGGHHGIWPDGIEIECFAAPSQRGGAEWQDAREQLLSHIAELIGPPRVSPSDSPVEVRNGILAILSGLTSVSDWLGSMAPPFLACPAPISLEAYAADSAEKAWEAVKTLGFGGWAAPNSEISMRELCGLPSLRPLQQHVACLASDICEPGLVLIEAPTGVGKTEAALYLADHWARVLQQNGMYVAMPTMATSNEMYKRVGRVLSRRYSGSGVNYQLLHGDALLTLQDRMPDFGQVGDAGQHGRVHAQDWFTKRKRGLLAPFAVGTVDQALLAILQTSHFFIRLLGLSHKTVVFDEVHAYDTYMERLFFLLLRWLGILRSSVIILSATLPENTRQRIVEAYVGQAVSLPAVRYPSVTWTQAGEVKRIHVAHEDKSPVQLHKISREPDAIVSSLREALADGGCAAVVCNTVGRSQELFRAIRDAMPHDQVTLFHARFPRAKRADIETNVVKQFGPSPRDAHVRSIVVATQVIEQSLDLDFDVMISDLAPIDLVLQRAGRLHRHPDRDERGERPQRLSAPHLYLAMPESKEDRVLFDRSDTRVYARYILLRSFLALTQRTCLNLPAETENLIEDVYGPEERLGPMPETMLRDLAEAKVEMDHEMNMAKSEAYKRLIAEPDRRDLLESSNAGLEEDDPQLSAFRRAATRLSPPSVTLICLRGSPRSPWVEKDGQVYAVDLRKDLAHADVILLANQRVETSDYRLVRHFVGQNPPQVWRDNAFLCYARPVFFDASSRYSPEGEPWTLVLDDDLGLMIADKEGT